MICIVDVMVLNNHLTNLFSFFGIVVVLRVISLLNISLESVIKVVTNYIIK